MRVSGLVASLFVALAVAACGDQGREMLDTAEFEELQNNREHARELYRKIIEKYPDSEFARRAKARLDQIGRAARENEQRLKAE